MKTAEEIFKAKVNPFSSIQNYTGFTLSEIKQIQSDARAQGRYDALTEAHSTAIKLNDGHEWPVSRAILALRDNKQKVKTKSKKRCPQCNAVSNKRHTSWCSFRKLMAIYEQK